MLSFIGQHCIDCGMFDLLILSSSISTRRLPWPHFQSFSISCVIGRFRLWSSHFSLSVPHILFKSPLNKWQSILCTPQGNIAQPSCVQTYCVSQWNGAFSMLLGFEYTTWSLGCLFPSVQFSSGWMRCFYHESENSQIPLRSPGNVPSPDLPHAVHFQNPFPPLYRFPAQKRAQTCNISEQMFVGTDLCLCECQYFSSPFITCAAGETTLYCVVLFFHGGGNVLETGSVCNCTAGEKTEKKGGESQCVWGFRRLIPESIFWCARWITSRVWLHAVRLLHQLMYPLIISQMV